MASSLPVKAAPTPRKAPSGPGGAAARRGDLRRGAAVRSCAPGGTALRLVRMGCFGGGDWDGGLPLVHGSGFPGKQSI